MQNIRTQFQKVTNLTTQSLTKKLHIPHLHHREWQEAQKEFNDVINTLSACIKGTCLDTQPPPLPHTHTHTLTHRTRQQGVTLPHKQQKMRKHHLRIYHDTS